MRDNPDKREEFVSYVNGLFTDEICVEYFAEFHPIYKRLIETAKGGPIRNPANYVRVALSRNPALLEEFCEPLSISPSNHAFGMDGVVPREN